TPDQIARVGRHVGIAAGHREGTRALAERQRVVQLDGLEHGPHLVVAVGAHRADAQRQIDLRRGPDANPDHLSSPSGPALRSCSTLIGSVPGGTSTWKASGGSATFVWICATSSTTSTPSPPGRSREIRTRRGQSPVRSEEHTSELQSRENLVCRLLLEKKNQHLQ